MTELRHPPDSLLPQALHGLATAFELPLHHLEYERRPPAGVYATSEGQLHRRLDLLLDGVEATHAELSSGATKPSTSSSLVERLDSFLDSAFEHIRDCMGVLQSFFSRDVQFSKNPIVRRYSKTVESYDNFVAHRVNHLKHNHGRLRLVTAQSAGATCCGYYFEGVHPDGAVGPHPEIHSRTPVYSFARDLRFHFFNIYEISAALAVAATEIGRPTKAWPRDDSNAELDAARLIHRVARLPRLCLPGEEKLRWPEIEYADDTTTKTVQMRMLQEPPPDVVRWTSFTVTAQFESDGTPNQKYQLPYPLNRRR